MTVKSLKDLRQCDKGLCEGCRQNTPEAQAKYCNFILQWDAVEILAIKKKKRLDKVLEGSEEYNYSEFKETGLEAVLEFVWGK